MSALLAELTVHVSAFLALLLVASVIHKWLDRTRLAISAARLSGLDDMSGINDRAGGMLLLASATLEITAAIALLVPSIRVIGAIVAATVWGIYLLLILRAIRAGMKDIDCGCSFGRKQTPLGSFQIMRNLALVFTALAVTTGTMVVGTTSMGLLALISGLTLLVIYVVCDQIGTSLQTGFSS